MKLKDYLHYYLYGNIYEAGVSTCQLIGIGDCYYTIKTKQGTLLTLSDRADIKLVLRRLEDMTEEEKTHIGKLAGWYEGKKIINEHHLEVAHDAMKEMAYDCLITANDNEGDRLGPAAYFSFMPYLLRQGFDLFGLIDAGLAIDIKTLTP